MPAARFGKIATVDIREIWPEEARDFTPWLASPEGLALLGDAIAASLELVQREASVGPFSADLLAKVSGEEDNLVVVENQFGKTDHDHLGKLLTYSSGLKAKTVVWIAEVFTDEHRQAIDWMNESAGERVAYFALEVYVIRIGDSLPVPQFKVVSSPNLWAKAARDSRDQAEYTATKLDQQRFWEEFREVVQSKGSGLPMRKPLPQHWYEIAVGRSNFVIALTVNTKLNRVGCELYISGQKAKQAFGLLMADRDTIEEALGLTPEWQPLESKDACRIATYREGSIYNDLSRPQVKEWLYQMAELFHRVFAPRVKALKLPAEVE
jgi:hypothetical protein